MEYGNGIAGEKVKMEVKRDKALDREENVRVAVVPQGCQCVSVMA